MPYDARELSLLLAEIRRPFGDQTPDSMGRDSLWDERRATRHRTKASGVPRDLQILKSRWSAGSRLASVSIPLT